MARTTSGGMIEPPRTVTTPTPLMTGLTPRLAYSDDGDVAVRLVAPAAATTAAAGEMAAVPRRRRRVSFIASHYMTCRRRSFTGRAATGNASQAKPTVGVAPVCPAWAESIEMKGARRSR